MRSDVTNSIFLRIKELVNSLQLYLYNGIHMIDPNNDLYVKLYIYIKVRREFNEVNHILFHHTHTK